MSSSIIAGADEAGRGCVIGPLVICIASVEQGKEKELVPAGAKDSKALTPKQRERIYEKLKSICKFKLIKITAEELNSSMKKHSLNEIEAMKIAEGLKGEKFSVFYVDSPDTDKERFAKRIKKYGIDMKIVSEHKADSKFPIVSAASIAAKVERDAEIERIKGELGFDFNSGYTSDPITIDYIKKNLEDKRLQKYLRMKWVTIDRMKQRTLGDFED
jgi:ribonuclease HII